MFLLGLHLQVDMNVAHIPAPYMRAVERMIPAFILVTLVIFWVAKLYHTLWRFANSRELIGIVAGGGGFDRVYDYLQLFYL